MAKWGEGDPRWIVEERPDATNVNNWHWTEKNATEWSKTRLKQLFEGLIIEDGSLRCEVSRLSESNGEAYVNNRKSKLIFFYEWQLEFEWSGKVAGEDGTHEGKINIPNFSEEYAIREVDVDVSVKGSTDLDEKLKFLLKSKGTSVMRTKLETYLKELKEEYSKDLILPTKGSEGVAEPSKTVKSAGVVKNGGIGDGGKPVIGAKIATENLSASEEFHCTAEDFYRALTVPAMVAAFTRSSGLVYEPEKGGKFSMFSGSVSGEFIDLVENEKITQKWRFKSWPDAHYSTVTLKLKQNSNGTTVTMDQTGIPQADFVRTKDGWKKYYWDSMRATFGFGAMLT